MLVLVLGLVVVARSYVDGLMSPDASRTSHTNHRLVWLRLLSVHQREAHKPVKDGDTCSSDDTQCSQCKHEWMNDATLQLISEYQKHVVSWDSTHKFYKLVNKQNDAWEEIAKEVGISVPEVKKKMNNGRN